MGNKRYLFEQLFLGERCLQPDLVIPSITTQRSPWLTVLSFLSPWWGQASGESDQQVKYVLGAKIDKEYARKSDFPAVCSHLQHPGWIVVCV